VGFDMGAYVSTDELERVLRADFDARRAARTPDARVALDRDVDRVDAADRLAVARGDALAATGAARFEEIDAAIRVHEERKVGAHVDARVIAAVVADLKPELGLVEHDLQAPALEDDRRVLVADGPVPILHASELAKPASGAAIGDEAGPGPGV